MGRFFASRFCSEFWSSNLLLSTLLEFLRWLALSYTVFFFFSLLFFLGGGWGMQEELDSVVGEGFLLPLAAAVHSQLSLKQCDQEIQKPLYLLEWMPKIIPSSWQTCLSVCPSFFCHVGFFFWVREIGGVVAVPLWFWPKFFLCLFKW